MEGASASDSGDNVEEVFTDFIARRNSLIKALTDDYHKFHRRCDPQNQSTCLVGFPDDRRWTVRIKMQTAEELPEPVFGINFARDTMPRDEWLSLVANHSDAWLLAVASFTALHQHQFHADDRGRLYTRIARLPTLSRDVLTRKSPREKAKEKSPAPSESGVAFKTRSKRGRPRKEPKNSNASKAVMISEPKKEDEEEDKVCKECGRKESLVCCRGCGNWFHGNCADISSSSSHRHQDKYTCRFCTATPP